MDGWSDRRGDPMALEYGLGDIIGCLGGVRLYIKGALLINRRAEISTKLLAIIGRGGGGVIGRSIDEKSRYQERSWARFRIFESTRIEGSDVTKHFNLDYHLNHSSNITFSVRYLPGPTSSILFAKTSHPLTLSY